MECQSRNICGRRAGLGYFLQAKPIPWSLVPGSLDFVSRPRVCPSIDRHGLTGGAGQERQMFSMALP